MVINSVETPISLDRFSVVTLIFFFIVYPSGKQLIQVHCLRYKGSDNTAPSDPPFQNPAKELKTIYSTKSCNCPYYYRFLAQSGTMYTVERHPQRYNGWFERRSAVQYHDSFLFLGILSYVARSDLTQRMLTLDLTGILQSAAFWVSNLGGTSGRRLFLYFYLMTTGLSAILGNDPVILSGTAFLVYFTKVAEVNPMAWLFSEFASCNTASMLLFVGIAPTRA